MASMIPVLFLLLFAAATGAFLLYRRKSISATIPLWRTVIPLLLMVIIGLYLLIDPESRMGQGVVRNALMFLLALSLLGLSFSFRRMRGNNRETQV